MATKIRYLTFAIIIFLVPASVLYAQSAGYFMETEGGETRFYQRLTWRGSGNTVRYEVAIEREVNGEYVAHLQESTTEEFILVSLSPGRYRYRVTPFGPSDRRGATTRWANIEVRPAVQPEILDAQAEFVSHFGRNGYELEILGNNLDPNAKIFLRSPNGTMTETQVISSDRAGGKIRIFVDRNRVASGAQEIIIVNPGGLEDSLGAIVLPEAEIAAGTGSAAGGDLESGEFKPLKPMFLNIGLGWTPVLPLHGEFFGTEFAAVGVSARVGLLFYLPMGIYIGPELTMFRCDATTVSFVEDNTVPSGGTTIEKTEAILAAGANFLAMKWMSNQKSAINLRLGMSVIVSPQTDNFLLLNIGASYLWRLTDWLLVEIGVDYINAKDGGLRPWIGMGIML